MMMRHFKRLDLQKRLPVSNLHILMVRDRISKKKDVSLGWWAGPVLGVWRGGLVMVMVGDIISVNTGDLLSAHTAAALVTAPVRCLTMFGSSASLLQLRHMSIHKLSPLASAYLFVVNTQYNSLV